MSFASGCRNFLEKISFYVQYVAYEIVYYVLGGRSILEDLIYRKNNKWQVIDRSNEVAIVTGGARGMGVSVVKRLLLCNMTVIIGCRNTSAGESALEKIRKEGISQGSCHVFELDLMSFDSIRKFAQKIKSEFKSINLVVNNAGIMFPPYSESEDGYESQWQTNYLGPFLLVHLLFPLLQKAGVTGRRPRVVNVTSCAHEVSYPINFIDINMKKNYIPSAAYAQSKLAQVLFTIELDRRLISSKQHIRILSVHPGVVDTDLFNGTPLKLLFPWVLKYICKDADEGATTILYPCLSPALENIGGVYLSNCRVKKASDLARDERLQKKLFDFTLDALKIKEFGC